MEEVVIAYDHGDVIIFDSISRAEKYLESIDVNNNEYILYNGNGRRLIANVRSESRGFERVVITEDLIDDSSKSELMQILTRLLNYSGFDMESLNNMELGELVHESLKFKIA